MNQTVQIGDRAARLAAAKSIEEQQRRKAEVMRILSEGLPTLPSYVLDLNALLSSPSVDLKKVGNVIRTDPSLSAQVIRLCNSALFGLRRRVMSIEQAAVLLGVQRLRTLVLSCSVMDCTGMNLPQATINAFWQHSFLAALLSEKVARHVDYFEKEQAYLGGLLHDIGQLPLWSVVLNEIARHRTPPPETWQDNPELEMEYFGMSHCESGRWMGVAWNFMPSFIDVFDFHHAPEGAQHDPYLVGIVSAADQFLARQAAGRMPEGSEQEEKGAVEDISFLEVCLPRLSESGRAALLEMLNNEYVQLLPLVELGLAASSGSGGDANSMKAGEKK